jgi:hypothetical protein
MNCRYVQSHLSAYIDMELTGLEQQRIRAHLECCMECSAEYESLRKVKHLIRQMPTVVPRHGEEVVLERIRAYRQAQPSPRRIRVHTRWWRYAWGAASAAMLFWFLPSNDESPVRPLENSTMSSSISLQKPFTQRSFPLSFPFSTAPLLPPVNAPTMWRPTEPMTQPFTPNPMVMPVVENSWSGSGTLQPSFDLQPR